MYGALGACRTGLERWFPKALVVVKLARRRAGNRLAVSARRTLVIERRFVLAALVAALMVASVSSFAAAQDKTITVFAAASMKNALDEVDAVFSKQSGIKVVVSYAASSALMKQIEQGAPADVFLSADIDWMDYGEKHGLIKNDTRLNLLGNRLVLIAPKDSKIDRVNIAPGFDLVGLAGGGRIATGDVRAALVLVARGEAPLGIVYETDAKIDPGVKIVGVFPDDSHPPIIYPVALTKDAKPDAAQYLAFLRTPEAKAIFERYSFRMLAAP